MWEQLFFSELCLVSLTEAEILLISFFVPYNVDLGVLQSVIIKYMLTWSVRHVLHKKYHFVERGTSFSAGSHT